MHRDWTTADFSCAHGCWNTRVARYIAW